MINEFKFLIISFIVICVLKLIINIYFFQFTVFDNISFFIQERIFSFIFFSGYKNAVSHSSSMHSRTRNNPLTNLFLARQILLSNGACNQR